jgi:hypothetical protein
MRGQRTADNSGLTHRGKRARAHGVYGKVRCGALWSAVVRTVMPKKTRFLTTADFSAKIAAMLHNLDRER